MSDSVEKIAAFLATVHPYDSLPRDELARVAGSFSRREPPASTEIYAFGEPLSGLFLIEAGGVE
ncbi:MAG: histidine kinase, partial [Rhodobacteraceae bacterium]|nr:histidine kinase [Paracoccaceae bacterium]